MLAHRKSLMTRMSTEAVAILNYLACWDVYAPVAPCIHRASGWLHLRLMESLGTHLTQGDNHAKSEQHDTFH